MYSLTVFRQGGFVTFQTQATYEGGKVILYVCVFLGAVLFFLVAWVFGSFKEFLNYVVLWGSFSGSEENGQLLILQLYVCPCTCRIAGRCSTLKYSHQLKDKVGFQENSKQETTCVFYSLNCTYRCQTKLKSLFCLSQTKGSVFPMSDIKLFNSLLRLEGSYDWFNSSLWSSLPIT